MRSLLSLSVCALVLAASAPAAASPPDPVASVRDPVVLQVSAAPVAHEALCLAVRAEALSCVDAVSLVSLEASSVEHGAMAPRAPDVVARVAIAGRLPSNRTPALSPLVASSTGRSSGWRSCS